MVRPSELRMGFGAIAKYYLGMYAMVSAQTKLLSYQEALRLRTNYGKTSHPCRRSTGNYPIRVYCHWPQ